MKASSTLSALFGLAVLVAVGYALWYLGRFGLGLFDGASSAAQLTAAAALTLLLCAYLVANGLHAIARGEDGRQQRAARGATYEHVLRLQGSDGVVSEQHRAAEECMLLYASPAALNAYLRLRRAQAGGAGKGTEEMADLVRAMRRDLGQRGADMGTSELAELLAPPAGDAGVSRTDAVARVRPAALAGLR